MLSPHETVSEHEWADGVIEDAKLAALVQTFRVHGYATVGNVIPAHVLKSLQRRMDYDAAHQAAALKWEERGPRSGAGGHLQMGVPRMAPFVAKEIVANPIIEQLAYELLDQPREVFLAFFNGNTNIPGSGTQLLHTDGGWDLRSAEEAAAAAEAWPQPTANLVFNFSTEAISENNGPTELWPGTSCRV
eukprot:SAG11_NODE_2032_length_3899_cov_5.407895_2_plen_189_part_00